jgi:hypothetical protein
VKKIGMAVVCGVLAMGQTDSGEKKIWTLLDDARAPFVALPEDDFRALGADLTLPDGGRAVTALAEKAPGGAFDPRDLSRIPARELGYQADWIVERFRRYNLDWDIGALRLTSLNPEAKNYPWFIIMNGGAANFYEFYVDLKNRPGWAQYLAQRMNVLIITIPGNFKYGGWEQAVTDPARQPAYLLDRDLPLQESEMRNVIYTNAVILQGVKQLVMKHTTGDILMIGHSTSGEISMLSYEDKDLGPRFKGRYLGWGSGAAARIELMRDVKGAAVTPRGGSGGAGRDRRPARQRPAAAPAQPAHPAQLRDRLQRLPQPVVRGRDVAPADCRALAGRRGAAPGELQTAAAGPRARQRARAEGTGGVRDRRDAEEDRQPLGHRRRRRAQGSLHDQLHTHGRLPPHGVDDRALRPESLGSDLADEQHRAVRRRRVPREESGRGDPRAELRSADDALRAPGAAAAAGGGALQRGALAGEGRRDEAVELGTRN